jgi:hypothetical protein
VGVSDSPNGQGQLSPEVEEILVTEVREPLVKGVNRFGAYVLTDELGSVDEQLALTGCPARKPRDYDLFRVRPGNDWRLKTLLVEYRGEDPAVPRGFYLINPRLQRAFGSIGKPHLLLTCITSNGSMFVWPVKITSGFGDSWYKSAVRIAELAETNWVRILGSQGSVYMAAVSKRDHGEPRWQGESLDDLLAMAFDGRIVDELTHPLCHAYEVE